MNTLEKALKLMSKPHTYFAIMRNRKDYLCSLNKDSSELNQSITKLGKLMTQYRVLIKCYCTPVDIEMVEAAGSIYYKNGYSYKDLHEILIYRAYYDSNERHRELTREIINGIKQDYKQVVGSIIL